MAVYELLGVDRKIPLILHHDRSLKVKFDALIKAAALLMRACFGGNHVHDTPNTRRARGSSRSSNLRHPTSDNRKAICKKTLKYHAKSA